MGIYSVDMVFPATTTFPFVYPKVGILVKYYEEAGLFSDDIAVRVFLPGDEKDAPSVVVPFPNTVRKTGPPPYPLEPDQKSVFSLTWPIVLSPCLMKQEGFIRVRVVTGKTTTNLGSLMVRKIREGENIQLPTFSPPVPASEPKPTPTE